MSTDFSALDYALALWGLGLSIFPLPHAVPGTSPGKPGDGKTPAVPWKRYQTERATEAEVREWFTGKDLNIAVVCGAISGIVVVDTDSPEAEAWARANLIRTPWRVETSKGWHRYYRHPGIVIRNRARFATRGGRVAIDVRADGGFVVAPGSRHASGHAYRAVGDWSVPVEKLPLFWLGLLEQPKPQRRTTAPAIVRAIAGGGATSRQSRRAPLSAWEAITRFFTRLVGSSAGLGFRSPSPSSCSLNGAPGTSIMNGSRRSAKPRGNMARNRSGLSYERCSAAEDSGRRPVGRRARQVRSPARA